MYEAFFDFKEKPFNITPDPKYLYLSEQHQEAIAHLLYGIQERGGFVVITGEIGTGKTTLCRHLINQMDERTEAAIILNPNLSENELLKAINDDFGISSAGQTKKELIDELNRWLLEERLRGKNMVLIIDEAQNLQTAVLEQIRMLSNLETEKEKLIQIILLGQPQLKGLLEQPELRQLDQRITARYHLNPLNRNETCEYIQHRLDVASSSEKVTFEPSAMKLIYKFSQGIPRLINVVCDRALLGAFVVGEPSPIAKSVVKQAISEVTGTSTSIREKMSLNKMPARIFVYSFLILLLTFVGWFTFATLDARMKEQNYVARAELIPDLQIEPHDEPAPSIPKAPIVEAPTSPAAAIPEPSEAPPPVVVVHAPPYSQEQEQELTDLLLAETHMESRLSAVRNLLSLWNKRPELTLADAESFYGLAVSQRMRCTELWSNLHGLRNSNAACILEMFVPLASKPRYTVLNELNEKTGIIHYSDGKSLEVPLELLDEFWLRRAFVFWQDFERLNETLKQGSSGSQIVWLQASLKTLGYYTGELTGTFDDNTEEAVRKFQREKDLLLDGIVGPKTKLALYANLTHYSMPRLDGETI